MWSLLAAVLMGYVYSQSSGNPYLDKTVYIQQAYVDEVQESIDAHPSQASLLKGFNKFLYFIGLIQWQELQIYQLF